jgi:hypothetical protein
VQLTETLVAPVVLQLTVLPLPEVTVLAPKETPVTDGAATTWKVLLYVDDWVPAALYAVTEHVAVPVEDVVTTAPL